MARARRAPKPQRVPLHPRAVSDKNFAHVLRMFPLMRMWAEAINEGQRIDFNDRNMVQMPVEIAEAFIRHYAALDDNLGLSEVCRIVVDAIDIDKPDLAFVEMVEPVHQAVPQTVVGDEPQAPNTESQPTTTVASHPAEAGERRGDG